MSERVNKSRKKRDCSTACDPIIKPRQVIVPADKARRIRTSAPVSAFDAPRIIAAAMRREHRAERKRITNAARAARRQKQA